LELEFIWHSDKAYIGFSIPNFIESKRYDDNEVAIFKEKINYYLIAGYAFDMNESIKFKPALLTKIVDGAPLQVDLSGNFMFNDKFVLGLAYRWSAAVSAMVGFQVSEGMYMVMVTIMIQGLKNYNSGSHEIFLRYEIFKNNGKITTQDSSKTIIMKKYTSLHNNSKCFFINIYAQNAKLTLADKNMRVICRCHQNL
jgi:hypothetical protein